MIEMILKRRKSTKQKMKLCTGSNISDVTLVSDDCDHIYEHFERKSKRQKMKLCTGSNIADVTSVSDDCNHNYEHFERCQEAFEIENNAVQQIFKITQSLQ